MATTFVEMFDISVEQPTMFVVPVTDDIMRVYLVDQAIAAPPFEEVESWEGFLSDWAVAVGEWTLGMERWATTYAGPESPIGLETLTSWGVFNPNPNQAGDERLIAARVMKWRVEANIANGIPGDIEYWVVGPDWVYVPDWNDLESVEDAEFEARNTARLLGDIGNPCPHFQAANSLVGPNGEQLDPSILTPCDRSDSDSGAVIMPAGDGSEDPIDSGRSGNCIGIARACDNLCRTEYNATDFQCAAEALSGSVALGAVCSGGCTFTGVAWFVCTPICMSGAQFAATYYNIVCSRNAVEVRTACEGVCSASYWGCCAPEGCAPKAATER